MITIDQAISDLRHAEPIDIKPDGSLNLSETEPGICITSSELIILLERLKSLESQITLRPISEWSEDMGDCLFYRVPINEPPIITSPLDTNWNNYNFTHFTEIPTPIEKRT